MRRLNETIFDDFVVGTTSAYTGAQHNDRLGRYDRFAVQVVADQPSGAVPMTVVLEHSGDGRNWERKGSSVNISFTTSTSATWIEFGSDADTSPSLGFVRLRIDLTGVTPSVHLKIFLTARDEATSTRPQRRDAVLHSKAAPFKSGGTCDDGCCGDESFRHAAPVQKGTAGSPLGALPRGAEQLLQALRARDAVTPATVRLVSRTMRALAAGSGRPGPIPALLNQFGISSSLARRADADGLSTNAGGALQVGPNGSAHLPHGPGFLDCGFHPTENGNVEFGCNIRLEGDDAQKAGGSLGILTVVFLVALAFIVDLNDEDEDAEDEINHSSCEQIKQMSDAHLVSLFDIMFSGPTLDPEEKSILKALKCLPCARVKSVIAASGSLKDFISEFHGDELDQLMLRLQECGLVGFFSSDFDDDASRLFVSTHTCNEIQQMPLWDIRQLILNMFDGATGDDDENAINKLVGCLSPCKFMELLKLPGVSFDDFDGAIQGSEWTTFSNIAWNAFVHCPGGVELPF